MLATSQEVESRLKRSERLVLPLDDKATILAARAGIEPAKSVVQSH